MLKRWQSIFLNSKEFKKIKKSLENFVFNKRYIVFTPDNTGANWLGIKNATLSMYPGNSFIIPQFHSQTKLSPSQLLELTKVVSNSEIKLVIFSGTPPYILKWINEFHKFNIECGIIFHGGLAEMSFTEDNRNNMKSIIELGKKGVISRIGVVKEGLDSWFKNFTNSNIYRVLPALELPKKITQKKFNDGKIHIGVYGNSSYNKNRHSQVAAASLVKNSIIHVLEPNEFDYGIPKERIKVHNNLNRNNFLSLLGSMDINIYCSFSESWGQVIIESLALKTPCIYSNNSGISEIINSSNYMVNEYDNIIYIANKIECLIKDKALYFNLEAFQDKVNKLNKKLVKI